MGYEWDFHMIFAGYEWWWLKGLVITIAYASATVAGGLLIGVVCGTGLLLDRWWRCAASPRATATSRRCGRSPSTCARARWW